MPPDLPQASSSVETSSETKGMEESPILIIMPITTSGASTIPPIHCEIAPAGGIVPSWTKPKDPHELITSLDTRNINIVNGAYVF